jgi:Apea-like HEPN
MGLPYRDGVGADVRDPHLFELASTCIREAHELIGKRIEERGWIPSITEYPALSYFDSGWPNISHLVLGSDMKDYSRLFGLARSDFTPIAYADIPHMDEFFEYARAHDRLAEYYHLREEGEDDRLFRVQVSGFVVDVLDRLLHLHGDGFTADDLRTVYAEFETGALEESLPIAIVVPIAMTPFDVDGRIDIGEGLGIERMADDWQLARAPSRQQFGEGAGASTVVVGAANHALVLDYWMLPNRKALAGLQTHRLAFYPLEEIERFFQALRIVTGMQTGFAQISIRPIGWAHRWVGPLPAILSGALARRYPSWFDDWGWLRDLPQALTAEQVAEIGETYQRLSHAGRKIGVAARRLSAAMLRESEDDAIIDLCIGLEAALGDESHTEITHKLALRTAAIVGARSTIDPRLVFKQVKGIYRFRSAVVHGKATQDRRRIDGKDGDVLADVAAAKLLRLVLSALLDHAEWRDPQRIDDVVLSGLSDVADSQQS